MNTAVAAGCLALTLGLGAYLGSQYISSNSTAAPAGGSSTEVAAPTGDSPSTARARQPEARRAFESSLRAGAAERMAANAGASPEDAIVRPGKYSKLMAEVELGQFDPLSIAVSEGIVWYGSWEDAMAEKERTGKPIMLHFGSPRCPSAEVCVPGTW